VLAGLGVAMVSLFTTQQASSNLDVEGARAYQAARAGIEWGLFQRLQRQACTPSTTLKMTAATLRNYTVVVTCTLGTGVDNPPAYITSSACNMVDPNGTCGDPAVNHPEYVRRRMEVQA